jgi:hypothetical protein
MGDETKHQTKPKIPSKNPSIEVRRGKTTYGTSSKRALCTGFTYFYLKTETDPVSEMLCFVKKHQKTDKVEKHYYFKEYHINNTTAQTLLTSTLKTEDMLREQYSIYAIISSHHQYSIVSLATQALSLHATHYLLAISWGLFVVPNT